jgi:hypothetical protein
VTTPWEEGTGVWDSASGIPVDGATWLLSMPDSPWDSPGGDYDPTPIATTTMSEYPEDWEPFDLTEAVIRWLGGEPNYGVLIRLTEPAEYDFKGSEYEDPSLRPRLIVHLQSLGAPEAEEGEEQPEATGEESEEEEEAAGGGGLCSGAGAVLALGAAAAIFRRRVGPDKR